ncbi:hypothetical protein VTN77DRAFT_6990 [Rasamsonia byssochlamydoides]|uniref:uncharacterized protein n=1 Tax=Rasamsonia byssochlamydoides TaxID=89139 RepID=UPI0037426C8D
MPAWKQRRTPTPLPPAARPQHCYSLHTSCPWSFFLLIPNLLISRASRLRTPSVCGWFTFNSIHLRSLLPELEIVDASGEFLRL